MVVCRLRLKLLGLCHVLVPFRLSVLGDLVTGTMSFLSPSVGCFSFRSLGKSNLQLLFFRQTDL